MKMSDEQKKFIKLYSSGFTLRHIAKLLHVSPKTLISWKKAFKPGFNVLNNEESAKIKEKLLASRSERVLYLLFHFNKIRTAVSDETHTFKNYEPLLALSLKILHELEKYEALFVPDHSIDLPFIDFEDSDPDTGNIDEEIKLHLDKK